MEARNRVGMAAQTGSLNRSARRKLIKQASGGDARAYLALAGDYFDLVVEYLHLCHLDREEVLQKSASVFRDGWRRLAFIRRVSEWDSFLAGALMQTPVKSSRLGSDRRKAKGLSALDGPAKFALAAADLENWDFSSIALALRCSNKEVRRLRHGARLHLLGLETKEMTAREQRCLREVSADFDDQKPLRQRTQLHKKFSRCPVSKDFRARWLDYRCHLIEMRQQVRLDGEIKREFFETLGQDLHPDDMLRAPFFLRVRKIISLRPADPRALLSPAGPGQFHRV